MARNGFYWGGHALDEGGMCEDAHFDLLISGMCGQCGFEPTVENVDARTNFWKHASEQYHDCGGDDPVQAQWLAYSSQMVGAATGWQRHINPLAPNTLYTYQDRPTLYDLRKPNYASVWAGSAARNAMILNRSFGASIRGIFADSICGGWWWGNPVPDGMTLQDYRDAQVEFCATARKICHSYGLLFGANVAPPTKEELWTDLTDHLDLVLVEHVNASVCPHDYALIEGRSSYRKAVCLDLVLGGHVERDTERDIMTCAYAHILEDTDYIVYHKDSV